MLEIGNFYDLEVLRDTASGLYLGFAPTQTVAEEEKEDSAAPDEAVLLPGKFIPEGLKVGDSLRVFIYRDNEGRLTATTQVPFANINQVAYLKVNQVNQYGAFLEWGIDKDLFVPFKEQPYRMNEGVKYLVYVYVDLRTDRLIASANLHRFILNDTLAVKEGDEVDIIIWDTTDLGVNVVINHQHKGLIYHNEIFTPLNLGDTHKAYIKKIREDNKIDVRLQKDGHLSIEPNAQKILDKIKEHQGFLPLNDHSKPTEIYDLLAMSKKNFKKALGLLYKQRLVKITEEGVSLSE